MRLWLFWLPSPTPRSPQQWSVTPGAPSNRTSCIRSLLGGKRLIDADHTATTTKLHTIELLLSDLVADLGPCFLGQTSFCEYLLLGCISTMSGGTAMASLKRANSKASRHGLATSSYN